MYYLAIKCFKDNKVTYLYPSKKKDFMLGYVLTSDVCQSKPFKNLWEISYVINLLRKHKNYIVKQKLVDKLLSYEIDELEHDYYRITTLKKVGKV